MNLFPIRMVNGVLKATRLGEKSQNLSSCSLSCGFTALRSDPKPFGSCVHDDIALYGHTHVVRHSVAWSFYNKMKKTKQTQSKQSLKFSKAYSKSWFGAPEICFQEMGSLDLDLP